LKGVEPPTLSLFKKVNQEKGNELIMVDFYESNIVSFALYQIGREKRNNNLLVTSSINTSFF